MHVCAISKETAKEWGNLCGAVTFAGVFIAFIAGLAYGLGNNPPPGSWDALVSGCVIFVVGLFGVVASTMVV
jgi:hypothetical protein